MTEAAKGERFSPELRLALALLSADPARRSPDSLRAITGPAFDWPGFADLVIDRHGVGPLIWHRLRDLATIEPPQPVRARLEEHYRANVGRYLLQKVEIIRVQRALDPAAIRPLLVKGPAIAERFYELPELRSTGDIDLLVNLSEVDRSDEILKSVGYRREMPLQPLGSLKRRIYPKLAKHFGYSHERHDMYVELHWRLFANPHLLDPVFWDELNGTTELWLSGTSRAKVLSPLAEVVNASVHGTGHMWARLKWLADLCPMIASLGERECEALVDFGDRKAMLAPLLLGADLAHRLLDAKCPPTLLAAMARERKLEALRPHAMRAIERDLPFWEREPLRQLQQIRYQFRLKKTAAYRLSLVLGFLFATADWDEYPLPDWAFPLYVFMRPVTWLRRRFS